jgi:Flp pilus assembly protein TadG
VFSNAKLTAARLPTFVASKVAIYSLFKAHCDAMEFGGSYPRKFSGLTARAQSFRANTHANTAVVFACVLPLLISALGVALDFGTFVMKRSELQAAADQAATAGAKQLGLASATDANITSVSANYLIGELKGENATATNKVTIDHSKGAVTVELTEAWTPFFAHFLDASITPIVVNATAALQGENRLCILTLNPSDGSAFHMQNSAQINAASCGAYSNSVDAKGMVLQNFAQLNAAVICSAGGIGGNKSQTSVPPQIDCPPVPDPLASRAAPTFNGCDYTNYKISSGAVTLQPGVYCGGLTIVSTAVATFSPGTYVIKDGPFTVNNNASVKGTNVGFYFTGAAATVDFNGTSKIDLSGAETGDLAGLLFFGDRAQPSGTTHKVNAANVINLTGTIYFPTGDLQIQHNSTMLGGSAYTAIIVNRFKLAMGPILQMNTNYGATNVPVPAGVRSAATVVLTN